MFSKHFLKRQHIFQKSSSYFAKTNISKYLPNGFQIFYMNTKLNISFPLAFPLRKQTEGNIDPRTVEPGERRREVDRH